MLDLGQDYFALFDLARDYRLDAPALESTFRAKQQALHPDRFAGAGDQERRLSVQAAAHVNEGYRTLKDPVARARYLFGLLGGVAGSGRVGPEFLMEQMELREAVESAQGDADPLAALDRLRDQVGTRQRGYEAKLAAAFAEPTPTLARIETMINEMQFLEKLMHDIERVEADLEDRLLGA